MSIFTITRTLGHLGAGLLSGLLLAMLAQDWTGIGPGWAPIHYIAMSLAIAGEFAAASWAGRIADADLVTVGGAR